MSRTAFNLPADANRPPPLAQSDEFGDSWYEMLTTAQANFVDLYAQVAGAVPAGTGAGTFKLSGDISVSVAQIGSSATNTTQTLLTYSLPANTLAVDGAGIEVIAWGSKAANAAPVTLQLNIGGASINLASTTGSGFSWAMKGRHHRRGSNVQRTLFEAIRGAVPTVSSTGDTSTDASAISITVQALDASAAQTNVTLDGLVVTFFQ